MRALTSGVELYLIYSYTSDEHYVPCCLSTMATCEMTEALKITFSRVLLKKATTRKCMHCFPTKSIPIIRCVLIVTLKNEAIYTPTYFLMLHIRFVSTKTHL